MESTQKLKLHRPGEPGEPKVGSTRRCARACNSTSLYLRCASSWMGLKGGDFYLLERPLQPISACRSRQQSAKSGLRVSTELGAQANKNPVNFNLWG